MKNQGNLRQPVRTKTATGSLELEILESLASFTDALKKGNVTQRFTCRQIKLNLPSTTYGPKLVKQTRTALGVSQPLFAQFLGVSPNAIRAWEQGVNPPPPIACRFMDEMRRSPSFWIQRLRESAESSEQRQRVS